MILQKFNQTFQMDESSIVIPSRFIERVEVTGGGVTAFFHEPFDKSVPAMLRQLMHKIIREHPMTIYLTGKPYPFKHCVTVAKKDDRKAWVFCESLDYPVFEVGHTYSSFGYEKMSWEESPYLTGWVQLRGEERTTLPLNTVFTFPGPDLLISFGFNY